MCRVFLTFFGSFKKLKLNKTKLKHKPNIKAEIEKSKCDKRKWKLSDLESDQSVRLHDRITRSSQLLL